MPSASDQPVEITEKIRQQFDRQPYPRIPIERSPKAEVYSLYVHSLATAFYLRNQQVIQPDGAMILDVGCGAGYKSLVLAEANPGARVVGIDLSATSVELARERLRFHHCDNAEFHAIPVEQVSTLGLQFDYINCDEVLYLLPDLPGALQELQRVLKPNGILRGNLHSLHQRSNFFRAQQLFQFMGLMEQNPEEAEIELVLETMRSLKDEVPLKARTWSKLFEGEGVESAVLANYLLLGDKGFTIPDLFQLLQAADLEFISMVDWRTWEILDLFKDPEELPLTWAMSLPELSIADRLHVFDLLCPSHRLLDFWCGHPQAATPIVPVAEWSLETWAQARVHLHPQLRTDTTKAALIDSAIDQTPFEISRFLPGVTPQAITITPILAACLLPLFDAPQPVTALVDRLLTLRPRHLVSLEPITPVDALAELQQFLMSLEIYLFVLLEAPV